ncbi:hypothetical protein [Paenibacillus lemnae]|uniref:SH3 domain-containing protein n=1 Tax=Paenibacillus lemnae TaxID=1330551 RepID=A0A848MCV9_PAELE|nr:hypothetical protein [Paenibacillus lemnae]NMO97274.1 hypothetical protein [Paenibacillus lemnae]
MKKTVSVTAALALALSLTAAASADPIQGQVTPVSATYDAEATTTDTQVIEGTSTTTTPNMEEPIIKADEVVMNPTEIIQLMKRTYFYDMPNGKIMGALSPQKVDTTGMERQMIWGGEWVEIYTWLGKAWIKVDM